jgi:hypothetical protein
MKAARRRLSLLSFAIFVLSAADGLSQEPPQSFAYQEGEFWQFKYRSWGWMQLSSDSSRLSDGIYEVVYSQKQFRTFDLGSEGKEELSPANAKIMYLLNPGRDFKFPLTPGSEWSYEYRRSIPQGNGGPVKIQTQFRTVQLDVRGKEKVTTDAGTFEAFKVVKVDRRKTASSRSVTTYYFSPETRSVVRMSGQQLENAVGSTGKVEIVLVKHGVASATHIADEPKQEPGIKAVHRAVEEAGEPRALPESSEAYGGIRP